MADKNSSEKKVGQIATLKKVMNYIRRYWLLVFFSLFLAAVTVVLTLYVPILTGDAVDLILEKGKVDFVGIIDILKKIAVAMAVTAIAQWLMNTCNNHITYHVVKDIRETAFHRLEELPLKYLDSKAYGDIVSRVVADGIYTAFYRCIDDCGNFDFYDDYQCADCTGGCMHYSGIIPGSPFHSDQNLLYV